jgi:2-C-methyl-D-erythritol 4-phosphate cytidylyltransferase
VAALNRPPRTHVLIPAAGGGGRFGTRSPKQYADLAGLPVIARTIDRLAKALPRADVIVALAPDDRTFESKSEPWQRTEALRCGGASRGETVANALAVLASRCADDDWILVHDAARPCVPVDALLRLVADLDHDVVGGLLAIPVADTLKREDPAAAHRVLRTEERAHLWQAQTPQMFRFGILQTAFRRLDAAALTDEAQAVEALAVTGACAAPRLVPGSAQNIKITYAGDLALAAAILEAQERP